MNSFSQTQITINDSHAHIVLGQDFLDTKQAFEDSFLKIQSIDFDITLFKHLSSGQIPHYRNTLHYIIKLLRDRKVAINLDSIREQSLLMGMRLIGPKRLGLYYYNLCTNQCLYCNNHNPLIPKKKQKTKSLSIHTIETILDQAYEMGVQAICISSDGEPLISPNATAILKIIQQKGFDLHLRTNGTFLKEDHIAILKEIKSKISVLVSISTTKKGTYKKLHRGHPNNFDNAQRFLSVLSKLKHEKEKRDESLFVGGSFFITKINFKEMSGYIQHLNDFALDFAYFKLASVKNSLKEFLIDSIDFKELRSEVLKARSLAKDLSFRTTLNTLLDEIDSQSLNKNMAANPGVKDTNKELFAGWFFGRIGPTGNYYICCDWRTEPIGNIQESSFKDFFFSNTIDNIMGKIAIHNPKNKEIIHKHDKCYKFNRLNKT